MEDLFFVAYEEGSKNDLLLKNDKFILYEREITTYTNYPSINLLDISWRVKKLCFTWEYHRLQVFPLFENIVNQDNNLYTYFPSDWVNVLACKFNEFIYGKMTLLNVSFGDQLITDEHQETCSKLMDVNPS